MGENKMLSSLENDEQSLATEDFEPSLSGKYLDLFHQLIYRMGNTLPANRVEAIKNEITRVSERELQNDIEGLKYLATLSVLVDLSMQGWVFEINGDKITLKMETDNVDDKQRIRYRLSAERNAQFTSESVSNFIKQMEADKKWGISTISVKKLIGDKDALIEKIRKQETTLIFSLLQMNGTS